MSLWRWRAHTGRGGSSLLGLLIQVLITTCRKTLTDTHSEIMFYQLPGYLLAQSSWHIKLTIIQHFLKIEDVIFLHFKKWIQNWFYLFIWKISNQVRKFCFHNLWVYFESCKEVIHLNHLWQEHCKSTKHCQISSFKMFFPQHEFLWKSSYFHSLLKCHHYLEERNYLYIQKYLHGTLILIATCHHIRVSKSEVCLFFSKRSYVWQLFLAEDTL